VSVKTQILFDAALPAFVKEIAAQLGVDSLQKGLVVRDTSGRLRFLSSENSLSDERRLEVEQKLSDALGAYVRQGRAVSFGDEPGILAILNDPSAFPLQHDLFTFRLLDRRIVGSAWVDQPHQESDKPPRIVFASHKGGVGRSTALAVTAADLARRNRNILVIDLDLEAPGIGTMLLEDDRTPRLGTIDYLVENSLYRVPDSYLSDFIGTSSLTTAGGGRVDVLPALGTQAASNPANTLAKLSRAMIEAIDFNGDVVPVTSQITDMITRLTHHNPYDVVLIDSRAGLSELAAPAILGLGATVLFFGTAQRQTIQGYAALFAALKLLAQRDRAAGRIAEWRLLFKAVYAKAGLNEQTSARYRDDLYELFANNLYDADDAENPNSDTISFDIDDEDAPHWPLVIPYTHNFTDFDPIQAPTHISTAFYEQAYRPFLDGIDSLIGNKVSGPEDLRSQ
jgi:hypothetical protein